MTRARHTARRCAIAKTADAFYGDAKQWAQELSRLRAILLETELQETVKWGAPCYCWKGKNVVGVGGFKSYFGLWFHQGALLGDPLKVLINAQEGKTKALRQWRMTSAEEIDPAQIRAYTNEALEVAKRGNEIGPDRAQPVVIPPELEAALAAAPEAAAQFEGFGTGKQREFADYISLAKRQETKARRLEKILPLIRSGAGLNDKYR